MKMIELLPLHVYPFSLVSMMVICGSVATEANSPHKVISSVKNGRKILKCGSKLTVASSKFVT